jgi:hypothetical protein
MSGLLFKTGRVLVNVIKIFLGALFAQKVLGALLVAGFTNRILERAVYKSWWKRSSLKETVSFQRFLQDHVPGMPRTTLPHWFSAPDPLISNDRFFRKQFRRIRTFFGNLTGYLRNGFTTVLHSFLVTGPGLVLMAFGWYSGWQNSFNKGYEHALVGPALSLAGLLYVVTVFCYLPLAQANLVSKKNWKAFYEIQFIRRLLRSSLVPSARLALWYLLVFVIVNILAILPNTPDLNAQAQALDPEHLEQFVKRYFLACGLFFFPALCVLKNRAGTVYGVALLRSLNSGLITEEEITEEQWFILNALNLMEPSPQQPSKWWSRALKFATEKTLRAVVFGFIFGTWFLFAGWIYIAQFFHFRGAWGWLNQPVLQLPWIRFLPEPLGNPYLELLRIAGLCLAVFVGLKVWRKIQRRSWRLSKRLEPTRNDSAVQPGSAEF